MALRLLVEYVVGCCRCIFCYRRVPQWVHRVRSTGWQRVAARSHSTPSIFPRAACEALCSVNLIMQSLLVARHLHMSPYGRCMKLSWRDVDECVAWLMSSKVVRCTYPMDPWPLVRKVIGIVDRSPTCAHVTTHGAAGSMADWQRLSIGLDGCGGAPIDSLCSFWVELKCDLRVWAQGTQGERSEIARASG